MAFLMCSQVAPKLQVIRTIVGVEDCVPRPRRR